MCDVQRKDISRFSAVCEPHIATSGHLPLQLNRPITITITLVWCRRIYKHHASSLKSYYSVFPYVCLQSDSYNALHLAVEQEDLTSLHIVEFIASNRSVRMYVRTYVCMYVYCRCVHTAHSHLQYGYGVCLYAQCVRWHPLSVQSCTCAVLFKERTV